MRIRYLAYGLGGLLVAATVVAGVIMLRDYRASEIANRELLTLNRQVSSYEKQVSEAGSLKLRSLRLHHKEVKTASMRLFGNLRKLQVSDIHTMRPLACKLRIIEADRKMQVQLDAQDISMGRSVGAFGFDDIVASGRIPANNELHRLLQRLELTEELIDLTARSAVDRLDAFTYLGTEDVGRSTTIRFSMTCTGSFASIRGLVSRFNHARYFFVVRSLGLVAAEGGRVTAKLEVDYLMFHELDEVLADAS